MSGRADDTGGLRSEARPLRDPAGALGLRFARAEARVASPSGPGHITSVAPSLRRVSPCRSAAARSAWGRCDAVIVIEQGSFKAVGRIGQIAVPFGAEIIDA